MDPSTAVVAAERASVMGKARRRTPAERKRGETIRAPPRRVAVQNAAETHAAIAAGHEPGMLARIMAGEPAAPWNAERAENVGHAVAARTLLEAAARMVNEARSRLIYAGIPSNNPALTHAARAVSAVITAEQSARDVLKALKR